MTTSNGFRSTFTNPLTMSAIAYATVWLWLIIAMNAEGQASVIVCPSRLLLDIPCPGCGTTRAVLLLFEGRVCEAVRMNANVIPAALFIAGYPPLALLCIARRRDYLSALAARAERLLHKKAVLALVILAELAVWAVNLHRDA